MRLFFQCLATTLLLGVSVPAHAQDTSGQGIEQTIESQITAFKADDFEAAFGFASPFIKQLFGTADNFGMMVQRGYPMVHRPTDLRFLELRDENGSLTQRVQVRDAQGRSHLLDYSMIETENGWQINGVSLVKNTGLAA